MVKKKKKSKPVTIERWDMGADGPANRVMLKVEPRGELDLNTGKFVNPNGVKGVRRYDMIEVWYRKGKISTAGYNAAEKLRDAYEGTLRGPGWADNDKVQASLRPDRVVAHQIDNMSRYHEVSKRIPASDRPIIDACVLSNRTPAHAGYVGKRYQEGLQFLREALDRLADALDGK